MRLHLHRGEAVGSATLAVERVRDGLSSVTKEDIISHRSLFPHRECDPLRAGYFPLDGKWPACGAGEVAEFHIDITGGRAEASSHSLRVTLQTTDPKQNQIKVNY